MANVEFHEKRISRTVWLDSERIKSREAEVAIVPEVRQTDPPVNARPSTPSHPYPQGTLPSSLPSSSPAVPRPYTTPHAPDDPHTHPSLTFPYPPNNHKRDDGKTIRTLPLPDDDTGPWEPIEVEPVVVGVEVEVDTSEGGGSTVLALFLRCSCMDPSRRIRGSSSEDARHRANGDESNHTRVEGEEEVEVIPGQTRASPQEDDSSHSSSDRRIPVLVLSSPCPSWPF